MIHLPDNINIEIGQNLYRLCMALVVALVLLGAGILAVALILAGSILAEFTGAV